MEEYIDSDGQVLTLIIDSDGQQVYLNSNNQLHRLDGPAIEDPSDCYSWFRNGIYHRIGGPQFCLDAIFMWYVNGKEVNIYYIYG